MGMAVEYLRKLEWSMGNGQCPECHGVHTGWHGHPCFPTCENIGHQPDCSLAAALKELGECSLMIGDYNSPRVFESYIDENGFYGMRLKKE